MSDKKEEPPRKLGTLSSLLASNESSTSFQRLKSLRTVPVPALNSQLRGIYDFLLHHLTDNRAPKKEENLDKMLPGPIPTLLQTSQDKNKGPQLATSGGQKRPERKVNFSMPNIIGSSTSNSGGPFAAGPPQQDKQKKSSIGSVLQEDRNIDIDFGGEGIATSYSSNKSMSGSIEINPLNPNHPTMIPYSEEARSLYLINLKEENNKDNIFSYDDHLFVPDKELFLLQLPSELPINVTPALKKEDTTTSDENDAKKTTTPNNNNSSNVNNIKSISNIEEGRIGKLKLFKSGKIKLQIGSYYYDILPGTECSFLQQIMVVSPDTKQCYQLGDLHKNYICIPDFEKML